VDLRVSVASIAALAVIIGSGTILVLKGPAWWHDTGVGHFFNSIHLWAVELFFFAMVAHLWGKYWMSAWRGGRARVWMTGAITFLVAVPTALTGYVSQQDFDAQWISTQAKDGLNSVGVGAFFNVTNFGQMYSCHVLLLPIAVVVLVSALLDKRAEVQHLGGDEWGLMNETGGYPGQAWLWLYAFWYQIEPFKASDNADILVMMVMGVLSLAFVCIPFIPGVRDLPPQDPCLQADLARALRGEPAAAEGTADRLAGARPGPQRRPLSYCCAIRPRSIA
jgi:hypothetical protein